MSGSKFIGIDGEAIEGKYVLLCASDGHYIYNENELSTGQILEYLLRLKKRQGKKVFVTFGLNYDVNMILRDLSRKKLEELWEKGTVWTSIDGFSYSLTWIPRKMFQVYSPDLKKSIRIYDVFGFFQSSFVKALDAWKIEDPHGEIKRMKSERARFEVSQRDEILEYCLSECGKLVELCDALEVSLQGAKIKLRSYMGAGSIAGAILNKEKVKRHHVSDSTYPLAVQEAIYRSYFGGRIEIFMQGSFTDLTNYDIRSAYPFQALALPSLIGGTWRNALPEELETFGLNAIWEVEWNIPKAKARYVMPFPLRHKAAIYYPSSGRGFYHHAEVRAAIALHPGYISQIQGFVFEPASDEKPFAFVRDYYARRAELKAQGHASEKAYKLGLNSLYGKLAQGLAYSGEPPYRSLFWAGRITSGTRARLLDAASLAPNRVISMATDGIVFSGDPGIVISDELGGWERSKFPEFFIAQPGIYHAKTEDGKEIRKSRGFFTREIDYEDLEKGWLIHGTSFTQKAVCECGKVHTRGKKYDHPFSRRRRFIGLGSALMRTDFSVWRTWQESERILSLASSRKFYASDNLARTVRLLPPRFPSIIESEAYVPKVKTLEDREEMKELIAAFEQPLLLEE
jgi:hypothetical protein